MEAKKEINILLEECDKPEEKLSIFASESGITTVLFAIVSTIYLIKLLKYCKKMI